MTSTFETLLGAVRRRLALERIGERALATLWVAASVFVVLLIGDRILGVGPDLSVWWILALPILSLVLAVVSVGRASDASAARAVDAHDRAKDLFLTRAVLGESRAGYEPLVTGMAETRASKLSAQKIVPLHSWSRLGTAAAALGVLALATLYLPGLDLLGGAIDDGQSASRQRSLEEHKELAVREAEVLRKREVTAEQSPAVQAALEELKKTLEQMRPPEQEGNRQRLNEQQRMLGEQWRRAREVAQGRSSSRGAQRFGRLPDQVRQWREELNAGSSEGLKSELSQLAELARAMGATGDVFQQQKLSSELMERLGELRKLADAETGSNELEQALARMMQQLQIMDLDGIDPAALEAMLETMELAELELDALAQMMRDMQMLERALEALQLAEALNQLESLEGAQCEGIGEYAEYYRELLAEQLAMMGPCSDCDGKGCGACAGTGKAGAGSGMGLTGGAGLGMGGVPPEDPSGESSFVPARSQSALTAGRLLMQMKSTEPAEGGRAELDYESAVRDVRQGVSEAILRENVPPGYHEAIRRYFDKIADRKPK